MHIWSNMGTSVTVRPTRLDGDGPVLFLQHVEGERLLTSQLIHLIFQTRLSRVFLRRPQPDMLPSRSIPWGHRLNTSMKFLVSGAKHGIFLLLRCRPASGGTMGAGFWFSSEWPSFSVDFSAAPTPGSVSSETAAGWRGDAWQRGIAVFGFWRFCAEVFPRLLHAFFSNTQHVEDAIRKVDSWGQENRGRRRNMVQASGGERKSGSGRRTISAAHIEMFS